MENESYYKFSKLINGDILLEKIIIDITKYTIITQDNGDKILKHVTCIDIIDIKDIKNYEFKKSKIMECTINNETLKQLKYRTILDYIYNTINDGFRIIKNSNLNIKTIKKNDEGFYYLENIGISVQGSDSNKSLYEIIKQCTENNIKIHMKIKLIDEILINVCF